MNNEKISYFAGFFDGEGHVGLYKQNGDKYRARIEVRVVNTYLPILEQLKQSYGGNVYERKITPERHKIAYDWVMTGQADVLKFLNDILPFLLEKKEKVENILNNVNVR